MCGPKPLAQSLDAIGRPILLSGSKAMVPQLHRNELAFVADKKYRIFQIRFSLLSKQRSKLTSDSWNSHDTCMVVDNETARVRAINDFKSSKRFQKKKLLQI